MAKKAGKSSSTGFGILDGLIDLAGGIAMNAVANHMEEKYHYSDKGKINPYRVSAIGIASGRMKTTTDIMRTGTYLGAKGSFNVSTDPPKKTWNDYDDSIILSEDPLLNAISDSVEQDFSDSVEQDNLYIWRYYCEDGSEYGIFPKDYETREEYYQALESAKVFEERYDDKIDDVVPEPSVKPAPQQEDTIGAYCSVSRLDNGKTETHWIDREVINVGDVVEFLEEYQLVYGVVVAIENP